MASERSFMTADGSSFSSTSGVLPKDDQEGENVKPTQLPVENIMTSSPQTSYNVRPTATQGNFPVSLSTATMETEIQLEVVSSANPNPREEEETSCGPSAHEEEEKSSDLGAHEEKDKSHDLSACYEEEDKMYDLTSISPSKTDATDPESPSNHMDRFFIKPIQVAIEDVVYVGERVAVNTIGHIIPKIEKIPWLDFVLLSILIAIPAVVYIVGFTKMGYGLKTFNFISKYYQQHAYLVACALAGFAFFLHLFDCVYWKSTFGRIARYFAISVIAIGFSILICFIGASHPYGPISLHMILTPAWLVCCKHIFYRRLKMRVYIPWLSGPLFFTALVIMAIWIYWTFADDAHKWTENVRLVDAQVSGCVPDFIQYPECSVENDNSTIISERVPCFQVDDVNSQTPFFNDTCPRKCADVYDSCFYMFIVWVGPFLVSLGLIFLSFFATFLRKGGTGVEQEALKFVKVWFFLLFGLWVGACLLGAGAGVSITLIVLTLSAFFASAIMMASGFSNIEREERVYELWMNLIDKYRQYLNVAKGLLVVTSSPLFLVYLALSFINQSIRNMNVPCSRNLNSQSLVNVVRGDGIVTVEARRLIREIKSWDLVDVFTYAIYWGIGFMSFTVLGAKFTVLILSWLIEQTQDMSITIVTGVLVGVGLIMFLLPPVPGVPIYLTLGIVMVPVGREAFGIMYSILYAMFISLVLKLFASSLQQKIIGGLLKGNVGIRQMVGVNTPLIRSFKLILSERGFSMAKISILCGGPDWPTSVLCGVIDLPLWPILVGTLPVIIVIIPTVLAGSFTYMAGLKLNDEPEFIWAETAAMISLAFSAIALFVFMLVAAYHVELTIRERGDEIDEIPMDDEVKVLDDEQVLSNQVYKEVTEWKLVPKWASFLLLCSLVCMVMCCYMVQLLQEDAFAPYELTFTIEKHLQGHWTNLVKPLGRVALLLFVASIIGFSIFLCWAKRRAKQKVSERKERYEEAEDDSVLLKY